MGINLLIVEEDDLFRMNLARRFQDETHHVFFAERQDQVKKILKKNNIDVVVLVLNRLKREGLSILKLIKKIKFFTEVIIINSSEQIPLSIEGMKLGAFDDFFVPVDIDSLMRRVLDAFHQKRKRESTKKIIAPAIPGRYNCGRLCRGRGTRYCLGIFRKKKSAA